MERHSPSPSPAVLEPPAQVMLPEKGDLPFEDGRNSGFKSRIRESRGLFWGVLQRYRHYSSISSDHPPGWDLDETRGMFEYLMSE